MKKLLLIPAVLLVLGFSSCSGDRNDTVTKDSCCSVTLDQNYDGAPAPVTEVFKAGTFLEEPDAARENYICIGWYRDEAGTEPWFFNTDTVTEDISLYAKWIESKCLVFKGKDIFSIYIEEPGWLKAEYPGTMEYSTDAESWKEWNEINVQDSSVTAVQSPEDGCFYIYFRGMGNSRVTGDDAYSWEITGEAGCFGNIMTLLDYEDPDSAEMTEWCYLGMFYGCTGLTAAPALPAVNLSHGCYASMFYGCTGLKKAPALPSTALTNFCYQELFRGCTGLTKAPELPATAAAGYSYQYMFSGCTGLTTAPALPATSLAAFCYFQMFEGCTGLTKGPELPAAEMNGYYCYASMFSGCTGLTEAPALPATKLSYGCYSYMFSGCTGLKKAPELPASALAGMCYESMFRGCTGLTESPELHAVSLSNNCYYNMFCGCIGLTKAPVLPATKLASGCYSSMFYNCTGLTSVPTLPATKLESDCYSYMFYGCTGIRINDTGTGTLFLTMPASFFSNPVRKMFYGTGGNTADPVANGTYYYE